ncbi:MAG: hypothetical protein GWM90_21015 [Gemmatimonadetes bacterium]|nr:hypothetical protein [Gemmatimonadota bacterium]NIQ56980.1 hypothetical protein [Gemmatimonadota bacterium]NIU77151.1 hypothetical protein [Gammaproteobacteria bacterium]NIX46472.1 hypothetical protein [Gemmatimonadota bacterium]
MVFVVVAAACASTPGTGERTRYDPHVITRAEIEKTQYETAYEVVRGLRSRWLAPVAGTSIMAGQGAVRVYVDGRPSGGLGAIPALIIHEIRYYPPAEAQARWGLSHQRGAIDVITREDGRG